MSLRRIEPCLVRRSYGRVGWQRRGLKALIGVLVALRRDVEAGYTRTLQELVHADVFAHFLEMADELLSPELDISTRGANVEALVRDVRAFMSRHPA